MKRSCLLLATIACFGSDAFAQRYPDSGPQVHREAAAPETNQRLDPAALRNRLRSREIIGQEVRAVSGARLGTVRELVINANRRIEGLILEAGVSAMIPETIRYIPWRYVDLTPDRKGLIADLHAGDSSSDVDPPLERDEFRSSELVGDTVRLETGFRYGTVTDILFRRNGRVIAVLVTRSADLGGGTLAFPIGRLDSRWRPSLSYFGLPYIAPSHADAVGLRVRESDFRNL